MKNKRLAALMLAVIFGPASSALAMAEYVTITPLGQVTGEFCRADRALLLEDPTGTRVLYDPGRTVAGGTDSRLGDVDVMLLSSVHSDHIGTEKMTQDPDSSTQCADNPTRVPSANSNFAEIAAATGARVIVGGEMRDFLRAKVTAEGGASSQVDILRHGGKRTIGGVTIAVVRADHANGVPREILDPALAGALAPDGLTAYAGPENGYVLTFSNGLAVYLSGDTGHTSDMATIVRGYYGADVAVLNMGDIFSMGPEEAAFAVNELIKPRTAIPSHANQASTSGGSVIPGTRAETFMKLVNGNGSKSEARGHSTVLLPLSGVPISCDGKGRCVQ